MNIKQYLIESTVSGDIATLDKKIGEEPIVKTKFDVHSDILDLIEKFRKSIEIAIQYNPVTKDGVISGVKSNVDLFMKKIKNM